MPQLDVYIIFELVYSVLIFFLVLLFINVNGVLLNVYLNLKNLKLKFFIEKNILILISKELFIIKNNFYNKEILNLDSKLLSNVDSFIFIEKILDIFYLKIKLLKKKLLKKKKKNNNIKKNNIELFRSLI